MDIKIICDTNIWIYLSNGTLDAKIFKHYELIASIQNLHELCSNYKLAKGENAIDIINAIRLVRENKNFISESPLQFLIKKNKLLGANENERNYLLKVADTIVENSNKQSFLKNDYKNYLIDIDKNFEHLINHINTTTLSYKIDLKKNKRFRNSLALKEFIKTFFLNIINKTEINNWEEFELFLNVSEEFWKDLMFANKKITLNDWFDLTNLIYVNNGFKYFTCEFYWINLTIKTKLKNYLVEDILQLCPGKRLKKII